MIIPEVTGRRRSRRRRCSGVLRVAISETRARAGQRGGRARRRPAILAVDDEPAVLAAVARDLRRGFGENYRIVRAGSGPEALELLERDAHAAATTSR